MPIKVQFVKQQIPHARKTSAAGDARAGEWIFFADTVIQERRRKQRTCVAISKEFSAAMGKSHLAGHTGQKRIERLHRSPTQPRKTFPGEGLGITGPVFGGAMGSVTNATVLVLPFHLTPITTSTTVPLSARAE
jgi:hypothetical protein